MKAKFFTISLGAMLLASFAAQADITIAVAGPMTGSEAAFGEQMRRGAEKAVADLNAKGGVLGQKIKLEVADDACDPKQAVAIANQLASKKVALIAGHFCSSTSIAASDVYAEQNILQISPASTNPKFTERKLTNIFRTCGRDDDQGKVASDYIAQKLKGKVIGVVHDKSAYGKGLADETQKALNLAGVKGVLYEAISAGEKDFTALVSKLKVNKVDVIYFGGYKTEAGLIVRQAREQGLNNLTLVGGDALVTEEYWAITGKAGEGTLMTFSPDPRLEPSNKELVEWFRAQKYEPEAYTLYTYATIQVWAQAAEKQKSTDTKKIADTLRKEKFNTVLGQIGFNQKGDTTAAGYVMYVWKDGKYAYAK